MAKSLGKEIYSGTAAFGRISATIGVIIGTLIGLVCLIIGISTISSGDDGSEMAGWIFIAIGVLVASMTWVIWYFTQKSKAFAALEGGTAAVQMISDAFRG